MADTIHCPRCGSQRCMCSPRPLMADTLTEKLRGVAAFLAQVRGYNVDVLLEAAAELDRREAIVAAAEALKLSAQHIKHTLSFYCDDNFDDDRAERDEAVRRLDALLALLPEAD